MWGRHIFKGTNIYRSPAFCCGKVPMCLPPLWRSRCARACRENVGVSKLHPVLLEKYVSAGVDGFTWLQTIQPLVDLRPPESESGKLM